jgi:glycosyltransferase involved in cell wall biosynthesis
MSLVIHAPNVHMGGGRALLAALLEGVGEGPCTAILDARFPMPAGTSARLSVIRVPATVTGRLSAELKLRSVTRAGDVVLCFGNLPPLIRNPGRVKVFLQNRFLLRRRDLDEMGWRLRLRIWLERAWLRLMLRDTRLIVQTASMAREVSSELAMNAEIMPFYPSQDSVENFRESRREFDFVYVASGEPHKNHKNLVKAWEILAQAGLRPSLHLTLDPVRDAALLRWIEAVASRGQLRITNGGCVPSSGMDDLYRNSGALIYASLFESFGLPLLEASLHGLPVVAPELDYVRDLIAPAQSFDPSSPVSIARAVGRFLGRPEAAPVVLNPREFLARVIADD